jgi:hypothetical protein
MKPSHDPMEKAIRDLGWRNKIRYRKDVLQIACVVRQNDWRPLKTDRWHGKEVYVIGADLNGNLFLRHSDGSVHLWNHSSGTDHIVAPSVLEFVSMIEE